MSVVEPNTIMAMRTYLVHCGQPQKYVDDLDDMAIMRLTIREVNKEGLSKYQWDWNKFVGSKNCLKWNSKDMVTLNLVLKMTKGRKAVVQAGANLGMFPKRLAEEFESVYTFEPDPGNFRAMMHNAPEPNIYRYQAALGCTHSLVTTISKIKHGHIDEGTIHVGPNGAIPTLRIDDFGFQELDLIYLDIEGYEMFALQGASLTIGKCQPVVAVEMNDRMLTYGITGQAIHDYMSRNDYLFAFHWRSDSIFIPRKQYYEQKGLWA